MVDTTTIVLSEDGRHVALGRQTEPDASEVKRSAHGLASLGLGGWLCRLEGDYYSKSTLSIVRLQILGQPAAHFDQATARFLDLRRDRLS